MRKVYQIYNNKQKLIQNKDWESVLSNPCPITVETLKTGEINSKLSGILNLDNPDAASLKECEIRTPVLANLICHEKYGYYLIDTGFDSSFAGTSGGSFRGVLKKKYFKNRYLQKKSEEGIELQIKDRNIQLQGVFLTHIHEHAAGAPSLSDEIPFIFGKGERENGVFPFVYSRFLKNKTKLQIIDFLNGQDMPILGKCVDIFGDGSFFAVSTPGHTKGHISYLINGIQRQVLITGDVSVSKQGFELSVETGKFSSDRKEGRISFLKLKEFTDRYPSVHTIFGHESDEFKIQYF